MLITIRSSCLCTSFIQLVLPHPKHRSTELLISSNPIDSLSNLLMFLVGFFTRGCRVFFRWPEILAQFVGAKDFSARDFLL